MTEAYAVRRTVPPSAEIEAEIDKLLGRGMVDDRQKMLGERARLGARLIIQRAVEEEFDTWCDLRRFRRETQARLAFVTRCDLARDAVRGGRLRVLRPSRLSA
jgi:hypothetical protein